MTTPTLSYKLTYTDDRRPCVVIGDARFETWAALLEQHRDIVAAENAAMIARMMTHLTYKSRYEVIEDPAAYEARHRAVVETETPGQPFEQHVVRTSSFGIPDYSLLAAPELSGETLRYCVSDTVLNVPYLVTSQPLNGDLSKQEYKPFPMSRR